jgi:uncharacterized membrane protein
MGQSSVYKEAFVTALNCGGGVANGIQGEKPSAGVRRKESLTTTTTTCPRTSAPTFKSGERRSRTAICLESRFKTQINDGRCDSPSWVQGTVQACGLAAHTRLCFWSYRRTQGRLTRRMARSSIQGLRDRWSISPVRLYDASLWVASAGAVETTLLTLWKVLRSEVTCAMRGCSDVLSSPYASLLGIPLTFFGALTYSLLAFFTFQARRERVSRMTSGASAQNGTAPVADAVDAIPLDAISFRLFGRQVRLQGISYQDLMFGASTFMLVFSGYLVWLLVFELQAVCPWCIFSAASSVILFTLACAIENAFYQGERYRRWSRLFWVAGCSTVLSLSSAAAAYAAAQWSMRVTATVSASELYAPPPIESHSSESAVALAKHLRSLGARMYGAYWCEHCHAQKELFGREAFSHIEYIECSKYGVNGKMNLCRKRHVPGYPTWEIRGELYPGKKSLDELKEISGYTGP